ncbi:hypothetical protein G3545_07165 [Starkeya sp. ORNL1]|uniref:hypothetical protein n=1 Tax=Starkeya sp. ORNL1 TaxID=2709380 RepID=UPI0014635FBD|nr:hypothetical protein [Starkeya sp. ORNL1]QJP13457.1 hypothetical protein G3545_07165 [Starkeya sp. ORNL1]
MFGIEQVADKATKAAFDPHLRVGMPFDRLACENGLIARCMGDVPGFSPPLIVNEAELDEIAERCTTSLRQLERELRMA